MFFKRKPKPYNIKPFYLEFLDLASAMKIPSATIAGPVSIGGVPDICRVRLVTWKYWSYPLPWKQAKQSLGSYSIGSCPLRWPGQPRANMHCSLLGLVSSPPLPTQVPGPQALPFPPVAKLWTLMVRGLYQDIKRTSFYSLKTPRERTC